MTREGIYVGNKEIVRRYVGDKIVWRKSYYTKAFSRSGDVKISDRTGLQIEFHLYGIGYRGFTGSVEEGKVEIGGITGLFSKLEADIYTNSYNNRTSNRFIFTFLNQIDKNKFLGRTFSNEELRVFKKVYK